MPSTGSTDPWEGIGKPSGVLVDEDIISLGTKGLLVCEGFDPKQVKQSCYELRVGEIAYFLSRPEAERKQAITKEKPLIVRPQEVVTIITLEKINLPDFILGRIISKGQLFSIGLSPVITYADPGFEGNLGITFINHSKRNIQFKLFDSISKIEFERLGKSVKHQYKGQHNYASGIWPIDASRFVPNRVIEEKQIQNNELLKSDANFFGEPFDAFYAKIRKLENKLRLLSWSIVLVVSSLCMLGIYFVLQQAFVAWSLLTDSMQSSIVAAIISSILDVIFAVIGWRLVGPKKEKT
jgi:dCTP deaminase